MRGAGRHYHCTVNDVVFLEGRRHRCHRRQSGAASALPFYRTLAPSWRDGLLKWTSLTSTSLPNKQRFKLNEFRPHANFFDWMNNGSILMNLVAIPPTTASSA
jgi:hypothetical protein